MKELEQFVLEYLRERKWDNLRPVDLAKSIMIEGAELLELFQWKNASLEEVRADKELVREIKSELADVLNYCLEMSVLLGLDTEQIIRTKFALAAKKYPAKLMRDMWKDGKEPGADAAYYKIKQAYRA